MIVLNDLYDYNLKIYQDTNIFKFSLDSILLSEFVEIKKNDQRILDFCSGSSPIPLILASRYNKEIIGIELQKSVYNLAIKSIKYNHLENKIKMINDSITNLSNYYPPSSFDIITCNPPYFKVNPTSKINKTDKKAIARHELTITLKELITLSSLYLKDNGKFYLVHRPERLEEIIILANQNHLTIKEIKFIASKPNNYAIMVLIKFVKNAHQGLKVSTQIINRQKTYQKIFRKEQL